MVLALLLAAGFRDPPVAVGVVIVLLFWIPIGVFFLRFQASDRRIQQDPPLDPRLRLLVEWQDLRDRVPAGHDELDWLTRGSGTSFRALDFVRRTRNRVAHADRTVSDEEVRRALHVIAQTQHALDRG
jgi:hypothetical protein